MTYQRYELVTMEMVQLVEEPRRARGRRVTQALGTLSVDISALVEVIV